MNFIEAINNYKPYNGQEEKDKQVILDYISKFDDILYRTNEFAHFVTSAFVVNETMDKVLFIHHNIYNDWVWIGGHADGESDLLVQAKRELEEESGLKNYTLLSNDFIALDILPVYNHYKNGKYVNAHVHLSVAYLFMAKESELVRIKADENNGVEWLELNKLNELVEEKQMKPVYEKIKERLKNKQF